MNTPRNALALRINSLCDLLDTNVPLEKRRELQTELEAKYHEIYKLEELAFVDSIKQLALADGSVDCLEATQETGTCAYCFDDIPTTYPINSSKPHFQRLWCCSATVCSTCLKTHIKWVEKVGKESDELMQIASNRGRVDQHRWQEVGNAMVIASKCPFCRAGDPEDGERFVSRLRDKAENGETWAQFELGYLTMEGQQGIIKDHWKAAGWLQKAADAGNVQAMTHLAYMWGNGFPEVDVAPCKETEKELYHRAARQGYFFAQFQYGMLLGSDPESLKWYVLSAAQGFADAQNALGTLYESGDPRIGTKNSYKAVYWLKKAALQGSPVAQMEIGGSLLEAKACVFGSYDIVGHSAVPEACFWYDMGASSGPTFMANKHRPEVIRLNRCGCCGKGKDESEGRRLHTCTACKCIVYCGKDCQVAHWKMGHKIDCAVVEECRKELKKTGRDQDEPDTPARPL